jgi:hypothetical protein
VVDDITTSHLETERFVIGRDTDFWLSNVTVAVICRRINNKRLKGDDVSELYTLDKRDLTWHSCEKGVMMFLLQNSDIGCAENRSSLATSNRMTSYIADGDVIEVQLPEFTRREVIESEH